jgi:excisionase family DNA binding protein
MQEKFDPSGESLAKPDEPEPWLTAAEAAAYLKVEPRTLLAWTRAGTVTGYVLSGTERITWRFRKIDLDATLVRPAVPKKRRKE